MEVVKRRTVKSLIKKLSSESEPIRIESMCELRLLTKKDDTSRPLIAEANAIPLIAESLYSPVKILQENAAATMLNLSISCKEHLMSSNRLLDALSHVLSHPASAFSAQCTAAAIFSLSSVESYRPIIGHKRDIIFGLLEIVRNQSSRSRTIQEALKALFGIALYPLNRAQMVELGAIPGLFALIVEDGRSVGLVEDATAVIAQVAGCEEGCEAFKKTSSCMGALMDLLDYSAGSSCRTKENAVYALYNLANCGGEEVVARMRGEMRSMVIDGIQEVEKLGNEKGKSKALALMKMMIDPGKQRSNQSLWRQYSS